MKKIYWYHSFKYDWNINENIYKPWTVPMLYAKNELFWEQANWKIWKSSTVYCIHRKRAMNFHTLQSWNECTAKYLLEWEWCREICFVSWWVVTHLWIIVCTKHLIVPSVKNEHSEVLGNYYKLPRSWQGSNAGKVPNSAAKREIQYKSICNYKISSSATAL